MLPFRWPSPAALSAGLSPGPLQPISDQPPVPTPGLGELIPDCLPAADAPSRTPGHSASSEHVMPPGARAGEPSSLRTVKAATRVGQAVSGVFPLFTPQGGCVGKGLSCVLRSLG